MRTRGSVWRWKWIRALPAGESRGCWMRSWPSAGSRQAIRCDNGPELTSRHFLAWCVERKIELLHIQPGKPTQNARVESFHGRLRDECLTRELVSELVRCAAEDRGVERPSTTKSVRTAAWDIVRRKSLPRRRQRASTQLSERQGTQTPSLAPRAPPSRLKPEMGADESCRILT